MKGKLKSVVPLLDGNGQHVTWTNNEGKLNYKFTVTFDCNGETVVGTAMSSKTQPSWKLEDEHEFTKTVTGDQGQYTNIKGIKSLTNPFGGKAPNPTFCIQKCYEAALECASAYFELNPLHSNIENIEKLVASIYAFTVTPKEEAQRWMHISGIRGAIGMLRAMPNPPLAEGQTQAAWLLARASFIVSQMDATIKQQLEKDKV